MPSAGSGPTCLPCDTDVLIQVFLGKAIEALHVLRNAFGIQPVITEEVEQELRQQRTHGAVCEQHLSKALATGVLVLADVDFVCQVVAAPSRHVGQGFFDQFQLLGDQYRKRVGRGEAYTHALGVTLGVPVASNDFRAVTALKSVNQQLPSPVLRFFDLLVFGYQEGRLSLSECNEVRANLLSSKEGLDRSFQHASFEDGLRDFVPRLIVADKALVGNSGRPGADGVEARLSLRRRC